jgi:hypothetical protein
MSVILTSNKTTAQAKQDVGQNGTENCSLNNDYVVAANVPLEQDHEENDFNNRAQSCLENNCDGLLWQFTGHFLSRKAQQIGGGQHGDVAGDEDG